MSDNPINVEEKSAAETPIDGAAPGHDVSLRTNARLRQKYYVDEKDVISSIQAQAYTTKSKHSKIIASHSAPPAGKPVMIRCNRTPPPGEIKVDVMRDGPTVRGIRINCPCGRHAELNFEYKTENPEK